MKKIVDIKVAPLDIWQSEDQLRTVEITTIDDGVGSPLPVQAENYVDKQVMDGMMKEHLKS